MDFRVCNALKIKPFQALLRNIPSCSLGEVGARGRATAKPKYDSSLDHLDSRNGVKCRLLFMIGSGIIFSVQTATRDLYTFLIQIFGGNSVKETRG